MTDMTERAIEGPANWTGPEMAQRDDWVYHLTSDDVAELEAAVAHVKARGLRIPDITRDDFPLPGLGDRLAGILEDIENGPGIALLRGLPVERLGEEDATMIYWGVGTHFGEVPGQNMMGQRLGHVRALGVDWNKNDHARGYQTTSHLPYHCDKGDVVGLLCLQTAKAGGLSCIASTVAVHNEMLKTYPDLLRELYGPFCIDHRGEEFEGEAPYYTAPVFALHKGRFFSRYGSKYVHSAQRFAEVPRLSDAQAQALQVFHDLAMSDPIRLDLKFEPGDMQFLNNHVTVHSRTDYEDFDAPERKRHLVRMLLLTPEFRDAPDFTLWLNGFIRAWAEKPRESTLAAGEG